jgi:hypothetical protein
VYGASENQKLPPNFVKFANDVYTPNLIAASDCMLGMMHNNESLCSLFLLLYGRFDIIFASVLLILGKI